jgi:hypothetical protein
MARLILIDPGSTMFKAKEWKACYLAEISGCHKDIQIIFRNFPCKVDISSGKKKYPYNDFGCELYEALVGQKLGDFSQVKRRLELDGVINETITLKNFRNIEVVLILEQIIDDKTFYHQVGEAMTDAIAKAGIKL